MADKGGFMTKERKKKLKETLRKKAAEELKKEQERKAAERKKTIEERCGEPTHISIDQEEALIKICEDYHARYVLLEGEKYDVERACMILTLEYKEVNQAVNGVKGRYFKPPLKKLKKEIKIAKKTEVPDYLGGLRHIITSDSISKEEEQQPETIVEETEEEIIEEKPEIPPCAFCIKNGTLKCNKCMKV